MRTLFKHSNIYETHTVWARKGAGELKCTEIEPHLAWRFLAWKNERRWVFQQQLLQRRGHIQESGDWGGVALVPLEGKWGAGGRAQGKKGGG